MEDLAGRRTLLASESLKISDEAIGVTALLLGYESANALGEVFEAMGCSPRQYAPNQEFKFDFT